LVLLAGRRLWHRFRGQPDPADLDRPDPIEVAMAYDEDTDDQAPHAISRSAGGEGFAGSTGGQGFAGSTGGDK
jgi:hypothetical protein